MEYKVFDRPTYSEYMDEWNYSQGFYVTRPQNGSVVLGGVRRVEEYSDERFCKAELAAKFAVEEHNKKVVGIEGLLKFEKIVNLNVEPSAGRIYYITMLVVEFDAESSLYQLKIWEKLNSGYQIQIFRPAPYFLTNSERIKQSWNCITIMGLMPWMDENYLYYKCFLAAPQVLGIKVNPDSNQACIWLKDSSGIEKMVDKYEGRRMPHSDIFYTFNSTSCL